MPASPARRRFLRPAIASSTFRPADYGTVLAWYDASTQDVNAPYPLDRSGNGRDLSTVTGNPSWQTSQLGGLPGFADNGANDLYSASSMVNGLSDCAIFLTFQSQASGGQTAKYIVSASNAGGGNGFDLSFGGSDVFESYLKTSAQAATSITLGAAYSNKRPLVGMIAFVGTETANEHILYVGTGREGESSARATANKTNGATVSASSNFSILGFDTPYTSLSADVAVGEVIVYGSYLDELARSRVRQYLGAKWGCFAFV